MLGKVHARSVSYSGTARAVGTRAADNSAVAVVGGFSGFCETPAPEVRRSLSFTRPA
jgi:hypothetical protein